MIKIAFALLLLSASTASAHDTFLAADENCGAVTVHLALDSPIEPDRVTRATVAVPGRRVNLTGDTTAHSLDFSVTVPDDAFAVVAVELAPETRELTPAEVGEHLDEIAGSDAIRREWDAHPGRWRETSTKDAKEIIRCGSAVGAGYRSQDMGFELFTQVNDPTSLKAGETMPVIAVHGKELMRDFPIVLQREGGPRVVTKTGQDGIAKFVIPGPGRYMLSATDLRKSDSKDVDWVNTSTTLTLDIK